MYTLRVTYTENVIGDIWTRIPVSGSTCANQRARGSPRSFTRYTPTTSSDSNVRLDSPTEISFPTRQCAAHRSRRTFTPRRTTAYASLQKLHCPGRSIVKSRKIPQRSRAHRPDGFCFIPLRRTTLVTRNTLQNHLRSFPAFFALFVCFCYFVLLYFLVFLSPAVRETDSRAARYANERGNG